MRCLIIAVLCATRIAAADSGTPAPGTAPTAPASPPDHKSEQTAIVLSLSTGVLLPIALVGAARSSSGGIGIGLLATGAIIVGPASGKWYAGESGGLGIIARLVGASAAFIGFVSAANADCETQSCDDSANRAAYIAVGGAALVVGSTIYDIATAGRAARRYNESQIIVAPAPVSTGGPPGAGLVIGGTF